ncbi:uncharacterized protein EV154DRAFT_425341 [Mucor mucedo]|uniref:uncharacterized protein n=1 Tax=Mucor mucedo TaxID=29922 RepID=UPI00221E8863|nr:uncharacterized protein EV154DRAFT_425341 [Mucor mucedo]KAI7888703.1 hypothetical protein EV154DRAFT_425341 [Mucor mucedo]
MAAIKAYGASRDTVHVTATYKEYRKRYTVNPTSDGFYMTALLDCGQLPMAYRHLRDMMDRTCTTQLAKYLSDWIALCVKRNMMPLALEGLTVCDIESIEKEPLESITQSLWLGYSHERMTPMSVETFVQLYIEEKVTKIDTLYLFTMMDLISYTSLMTPTHRTLHLLLEYAFDRQQYGRVIRVLSSMTHDSEETMQFLAARLGPHTGYAQYVETLQSQLDSGKETKRMLARGDETVMDWLRDTGCQDLDCYAMVLEHWLTCGRWKECIRAYGRLKTREKGTMTNRRLVKAYVTARCSMGDDWMGVERALTEGQIRFTSTTVTRMLMTMMGFQSKTGVGLVPGKHVLTALTLMEKKLDVQLSGEELARLISGLGKRGDVENGFRLYTWVREQKGERCASSHLYRAMMTSATKNNDIRKLERVWVDMQYRKRFLDDGESEKEEHSLTRYNVLLNGYASRLPKPDLTRVKKVFQRLLGQNLSPDIVTYNILIKAFVNANNMEAANQIFQKMIQSGIQPDTYSTNTLLNGWIIRKDWHHVETFVKELKKGTQQELDVVTFNLLVQSFLQLDSKTMNYTHWLKQQKKGAHLKQMETSSTQVTGKMSSQKIWSIFRSTTGYGPDLKPTAMEGFVKLFSTEADEVTGKLFMKAFVNIKDYPSAAKIQKWMTLIPHNNKETL